MREQRAGDGADGLLVGRDDALAALGAALAAARGGRPRTVLVEGVAGAGKTTLIRRFAGLLAGARVVEVRGSQDEELVAFGLVEVLLRRLGADGGAGPAAGFRPGDLGEAGGRVLAGLAAAEREGSPLVLVVDDAH